ncbi:MAG: hypothetical protein ACTS82_02980, partial [Arsenophonus sp. ET-DL12-MAG3]
MSNFPEGNYRVKLLFLWKYLMLIVVLFIGLLYSLPNLYGEDPAIQIT